MKLIIGLGNPGIKYAATRHNFGFRAMDALASAWQVAFTKNRYQSLYAEVNVHNQRFVLVKPQTFMNLSGRSARPWRDFYHIDLQDILVIYDDISLDIGRVRVREGGSAGGHNGMKSLIEHFGSDAFPRLRLGVGPQPPRMDSADYVLQSFRPSEWDAAEDVISIVPDIVVCWSHEGLTQAMNRYNGWEAPSLSL